jgi:methylmalonyl-CoA mutase C-terminal domain/subunit
MAKAGLDGHDRGAKVVARALRDAGFEVIYSGLHQTIRAIAQIALEEDVHVVGLSVLSGAHVPYTRDLRAELDQLGMKNVTIVVGGIVPQDDAEAVLDAGAAAVFPPNTDIHAIPDVINRILNEEPDGVGVHRHG